MKHNQNKFIGSRRFRGKQESTFDRGKDSYSSKPLIFDGERFDYWKDRIRSYLLGFDIDLWDIVVDGYTYLVDEEGREVPKSALTDAQKKM